MVHVLRAQSRELTAQSDCVGVHIHADVGLFLYNFCITINIILTKFLQSFQKLYYKIIKFAITENAAIKSERMYPGLSSGIFTPQSEGTN